MANNQLQGVDQMRLGEWAVMYTDTKDRLDSVWGKKEEAERRVEFLYQHALHVKDIRIKRVISWEFTGKRKLQKVEGLDGVWEEV